MRYKTMKLLRTFSKKCNDSQAYIYNCTSQFFQLIFHILAHLIYTKYFVPYFLFDKKLRIYSNIPKILYFCNLPISNVTFYLISIISHNIKSHTFSRLMFYEFFPFLSQVQVSVLKEEKRNLLRQVDELSKTNFCNNDTLHRHRSQSFSEQRATALRNLKNTGIVSTRDIGTMCGVMTRDIGVSHQQVHEYIV